MKFILYIKGDTLSSLISLTRSTVFCRGSGRGILGQLGSSGRYWDSCRSGSGGRDGLGTVGTLSQTEAAMSRPLGISGFDGSLARSPSPMEENLALMVAITPGPWLALAFCSFIFAFLSSSI